MDVHRPVLDKSTRLISVRKGISLYTKRYKKKYNTKKMTVSCGPNLITCGWKLCGCNYQALHFENTNKHALGVLIILNPACPLKCSALKLAWDPEIIKRSVKLEINLTVFSKLSKTRRHFRLNLSPQTRLRRISLEQKCLSLFDNSLLLLNIN